MILEGSTTDEIKGHSIKKGGSTIKDSKVDGSTVNDTKKVILLLVDSLMPEILEDCIRHKTVPALQFLQDRGRYWRDCVTVFPTMTASVDSSLVTGVYPHEHRVPGLIWYDPEERTIVNYINGGRCIWKQGLANCAEQVLYNLNEKHLSKQVTTVFEELSRLGKTSASINAIVHRGDKVHRIRLPFTINAITKFRLQNGEISGPDHMTLGAMAQTELERRLPRHIQGARQRYGINDAYAIQAAIELMKSGEQPDFMLVYLPDNDHEVHTKNPAHAESALIHVDQHIQRLLDVYDSWDEALRHCVFIITSDHGQTRIGREDQFNIDLDRLLAEFRVLQLGEPFNDHELVVCNNERMAYLYPLHKELMEPLLERLESESRIDLIAWKEQQGVAVREGGSGRKASFRPDGGAPHRDTYGTSWTVEGEWRTLDLSLDPERRTIEYGDYPDVLSRLYGALYSQDIPVVIITARPRYEFKTRYFPMHLNGGSHGSLHKYDSLIPLIVAGTDHPVREPPRLVDLKHFIVELLVQKTSE